jgi:hypothetical protein
MAGKPSGSYGQCYAPLHLNADGTGTNDYWREWVAGIASHVNNSNYLNGSTPHAHIRYWEIWNEVDNSCSLNPNLTQPNCWANFWEGTYDQLQRMTEDARCIIVGGSFYVSATKETCKQVQSTVGLSGPIDPTAKIVMPSTHSELVPGVHISQNMLYCNNSPKASCAGGGMASAVDILNSHMKPGNQYPTPIEQQTLTDIGNFKAILRSTEQAKPFFNGEAGYSGKYNGFPGGGPYADVDNQESFIPRYFLMSFSNGIASLIWDNWDSSNTLLGNTPLIQAWTTTYNWLVGTTFSTPCSSSGTIYTCAFTGNARNYFAVWDSTQFCSGGSCPTVKYTAAPQYTSYQDIAGVSHSVPQSHVVPIGIKPIMLIAP